MAFMTLAATQLFHSYNVKSDRTIFQRGTLRNRFLNIAFLVGFAMQLIVIYVPGINTVFNTVALSAAQLAISVGLAFGMVMVMEIYKLFANVVFGRKAKSAQ